MKLQYCGHFGEGTGFARAAEENVRALRKVGHLVECHQVNARDIPEEFATSKTIVHDDALIMHTLPLDCRAMHGVEDAPDTLIAYTTWEGQTAPREVGNALSFFDEVWTPSFVSAQAIEASGRDVCGDLFTKVQIVPHTVTSFPWRDLAITKSSRFRFYWSGAWNARKNPSGLIRAYLAEFTNEDNVELYLHSSGTPIEMLTNELAMSGIAQKDLPRIRFNAERLSDEKMWELHRYSDCFVSCARGEAWNLPAFEALQVGNHVITQLGLGSDDYLSIGTQTPLIVPLGKVPAWNSLTDTLRGYDFRGDGVTPDSTGARVHGAQGLTSKCLWLEPDLVQFGFAMRRIWNMATLYGTKQRVDYALEERYSHHAIGTLMTNLLEKLT